MANDLSQYSLEELEAIASGEEVSPQAVEENKNWTRTKEVGKGIRDSLTNIGISGVNTLSKLPKKAGISEYEGLNIEPLKTGEGPWYEGGAFAGNTLPYLVPATGLGRIGLSGTLGAFGNPEDPLSGLLEGLGWGAAGEAIAPGAGWVKNKFTRSDLAEKLKPQVQKAYKEAKRVAWEPVAGLFDKYGDVLKAKPEWVKTVTEAYEKNKDFMSSSAKKLFERFSEKPSLNNMQDFQSELGKGIRKLDESQSPNIRVISDLSETRDLFTRGIGDMLEYMEPGGASKYSQALENYATGPGLFRESNVVDKLLEGVSEGISPEQVIKDLKQTTQKIRPEGPFAGEQVIPEEHFLRDALAQSEAKMARSKAYGDVGKLGSTAALSALGYGLYGAPGLLGGLAGNAARTIAKPIGSALTNPEAMRYFGAATLGQLNKPTE